MEKRIVFENENGGVSIIVPAPSAGLTIQQIAKKDVPAGKPYQIVDVSDIPSDRTWRNAWTVNEADLTDGVGAESNEFQEQA